MAPGGALHRSEPQSSEHEGLGMHAELRIDQDVELVGDHLVRDGVQGTARHVPEGLRRRGDRFGVLGHRLVRVVHEDLEPLPIQIGDPRGEVSPDDAIEEKMAEETDPDSLSRAFLLARPEKLRKRGFEHAPHGGPVALLQGAIVAPW
jgi:hypothetical protein